MSTQLETNTMSLQNILNTINELPEAGGSGGGSGTSVGEWVNVMELPTTYGYGDDSVSMTTKYLEVNSNISSVLIWLNGSFLLDVNETGILGMSRYQSSAIGSSPEFIPESSSSSDATVQIGKVETNVISITYVTTLTSLWAFLIYANEE